MKTKMAVTLSAGLALAGGSLITTDQASAETLPVAALVPLTGGSADTYGASMLAGLNCVFDEVNAAGGVKIGETQYTIELTPFDDKLKAEDVQIAARRALDEGYEFIIGPIGSGVASAVQPIMARSEAFWMIAPVSVPGPTRSPNVFRPAALITTYNDATIEWLKTNPEIQKVAMITDQVHTGLVSAEPGLVEGIKSIGREVVAIQQSKFGDTDFRAPITEVIGLDADLYIHRTYSAEAALLVQQTRELGGDMIMQWNAGLSTGEARAIVPDESVLEGVTQVSPLLSLDVFVAEGNEKAMSVAACAESKKGNGSFTASGHDAAIIFVEGLKKATEPTPEAMIAALNALTASEIAGKTLNVYEGQEDDKVFKDREVQMRAIVQEWKLGTGWVRAE